MVKTSIDIPQEQLDDLDKIAKIRGMNRSQVMRKANTELIDAALKSGEYKRKKE